MRLRPLAAARATDAAVTALFGAGAAVVVQLRSHAATQPVAGAASSLPSAAAACLTAASGVRPGLAAAAPTSDAVAGTLPLRAFPAVSRWAAEAGACRFLSGGGGIAFRRAGSICGKHCGGVRCFAHFRRVAHLPLDARMRENLSCMQIKHLTHVQHVTFFPILFGRDVVAAARSGTGKTLAYLLPLLQRLLNTGALSMCGGLPPALLATTAAESFEDWHQMHVDTRCAPAGDFASPSTVSSGRGPAAVILVPTRELCQQVTCTALSLLPSLSVVVADPGAALQQQEHQLAAGPVDVVVGTPSRCLLLHQRGGLQLRNLRCLVLDEADLLLSRGYADKIDRLLEANGFARWASAPDDNSPQSEQRFVAGRGSAGRRLPPLCPKPSTAASPGASKRRTAAASRFAAATAEGCGAATGGVKATADRVGRKVGDVWGERTTRKKLDVCVKADQEERQHQGPQQRCQGRNRVLQRVLFSSLMPAEITKMIESRLQGAAVFSLIKDKKGRPNAAGKREDTEAELETAASATPLTSTPVAAPPTTRTAAREENSGRQASVERPEGARCSTAVSTCRSAALCNGGASVRHLTCKISNEVVARAAEDPAALNSASAAHFAPSLSGAVSKSPPADSSRTGSGTTADSSTEARMLVLLYLIARKLPGPLSAWWRKRDGPRSATAATSPAAAANLPAEEGFQDSPKCIVFVDTHQEVEYVAQHPLLEPWHIAPLHSGMTQEKRNFNLQQFRTGEASVLVSTDVLARGIDVSSVVLVVHFRPPADSSIYIHRAGRAGRGGVRGESVVLYTPDESRKIRKLKRETRTDFVGVPPPTAAEHQEVVATCMFQALLEVEDEYCAPHLARAERLVKSHGKEILASALTLLYHAQYSSAREAELETQRRQDVQQLRSLLTGRKNYAALLLYDPAHSHLKTPEEAARYIKHFLPSNAPSNSIGQIMRSARGYVADVALGYADQLISKTAKRRNRSGRRQALVKGVSILPVEELPELLMTNNAMRLPKARRARLAWAPTRWSPKSRVGGMAARCVLRSRINSVSRTR